MLDLNLLKLRNLIASKEFEISIANRETVQFGQWTSNHPDTVAYIDIDMQKLIKEIEEER